MVNKNFIFSRGMLINYNEIVQNSCTSYWTSSWLNFYKDLHQQFKNCHRLNSQMSKCRRSLVPRQSHGPSVQLHIKAYKSSMHDLESKNHVWTVDISWFNVNGKFMEAEKIILWKIEIHAVWQRHPWNVERGIHLIKHGSMLRIKLLHIQYCYSAKALDDFQLTNHKPDQSEIQNSLLVLNFIHQLPILYGYLPCQTLKITLEAYQTKIFFLNNNIFQNAYFGNAT